MNQAVSGLAIERCTEKSYKMKIFIGREVRQEDISKRKVGIVSGKVTSLWEKSWGSYPTNYLNFSWEWKGPIR